MRFIMDTILIRLMDPVDLPKKIDSICKGLSTRNVKQIVRLSFL